MGSRRSRAPTRATPACSGCPSGPSPGRGNRHSCIAPPPRARRAGPARADRDCGRIAAPAARPRGRARTSSPPPAGRRRTGTAASGTARCRSYSRPSCSRSSAAPAASATGSPPARGRRVFARTSPCRDRATRDRGGGRPRCRRRRGRWSRGRRPPASLMRRGRPPRDRWRGGHARRPTGRGRSEMPARTRSATDPCGPSRRAPLRPAWRPRSRGCRGRSSRRAC